MNSRPQDSIQNPPDTTKTALEGIGGKGNRRVFYQINVCLCHITLWLLCLRMLSISVNVHLFYVLSDVDRVNFKLLLEDREKQ